MVRQIKLPRTVPEVGGWGEFMLRHTAVCLISSLFVLSLSMDIEAREKVGKLIKEITESGEWTLDSAKLKVL